MLLIGLSRVRCLRCRRRCLARQTLTVDVDAVADDRRAVGHLARRARPAVGPWCRPVRTRRRE